MSFRMTPLAIARTLVGMEESQAYSYGLFYTDYMIDVKPAKVGTSAWVVLTARPRTAGVFWKRANRVCIPPDYFVWSAKPCRVYKTVEQRWLLGQPR